jgi:hypothetical protein
MFSIMRARATELKRDGLCVIGFGLLTGWLARARLERYGPVLRPSIPAQRSAAIVRHRLGHEVDEAAFVPRPCTAEEDDG